MGDLKNIFKRIKKNPETIPIKGYRFLKRKVFSKFPHKQSNLKGIILNGKHLLQEKNIKNEELITEAEEILQGKYKILGKDYTLQEINWHKDFNTGKIWEKKHWTEIEYDTEGDKKIPWELSKCHHFLILGLAYHQTKEKKYFGEYKKQFLNWIEENPYEIGINWITPMECAIRAINWIQSHQVFKEEFDEELTTTLSKQLYLHGRFIRKNMEWSPAKENHYLSDCMGLFFIGLFFKNLPEADSWKRFAQKELEKEMFRQVSEDGVDYEGSLNYHRLVTEIFLLCFMLAEKNNLSFSEPWKKRLEKMCEFIMYYTSPTGKAPAFGDTDNSRILPLWNPDTNDHRDLLTIASVLFQRGDFKAKGKFHTTLLLLITKEDYDKIETKEIILQSKAFTDYYIIRNKDLFLMIHCGDIGRNGFGGHGHNDQLSFVLSTQKAEYIIDPGTYCYTSDKEKRHLLRSTAYHNTPLINNQEQNPIEEKTPFDMGNKTKAFCFQWQSDHYKDIFIGKHLGYIPNIVTREIYYDKKKKELTITDRLKEEAEIELNISLHPEREIKQERNRIILDKEISIECEKEPIISESLYSRDYGHLSETKRITIKKKGTAHVTKIYFMNEKEET